MHVLQCTNGHFFDGDKYSVCPHCGAASAGGDSKKRERSDSIFHRNKPKTVSRSQSQTGAGDDVTVVLPQSNETAVAAIPSVPPVAASSPSAPAASAVAAQQNAVPVSVVPQAVAIPAAPADDGKTMGFFSSNIGVAKEPVVGWLVCVKGMHFGEAFELYAGRNSIGRDGSNKVVISGDNTVSSSKHLWVTYEPKKREFFVQPGESSGLSYLNGENIMIPQAFKTYDKLEIGSGEYLLVPLCCENFTWEDYTNNQ